ncbi:STAS domain-containing protein [Nocardioides sp. LS1]|uniref:STAS domain-containing protein n=1 Tax=Nocardioides sp. LS1 TaxID=1027620 RepID=UPI000F617163|nr:STAS domain-containing protein [Nocardioides sp. LS1]GCD88233.1 hypothetical protein NLS1_02390 [Nocardioides sp. LS1]
MHEPSPLPTLLKISLVPDAPYLFLDLGGELDLSGVGEVPMHAYADRRDITTVLVDLGELTFCDATGLRTLLSFQHAQEELGRTVSVVRASPVVWRLMRICGLTERLEFTPQLDTAV